VLLLEHRLVVERVLLADAAVHEQLNDPPRPRLVVEAAFEVGAGLSFQQPGLAEQRRQGDAAQAAPGLPEHIAT
jgi:hypothetical protein